MAVDPSRTMKSLPPLYHYIIHLAIIRGINNDVTQSYGSRDTLVVLSNVVSTS